MRDTERTKFHRNRKRVRLSKLINGPLFVAIVGGLLVTVCGGLAVFFISDHFQKEFSKAQAQLQNEQSKRANKINSASAAQDEIIRSLSKRFIGIAVVVAAYREHYEGKQYDDNLNYYIAAEHEWDLNLEVTKLKIKIYFPDAKIQKNWEHLLEELDTFDQAAKSLVGRFARATTASKKLDAAVASCDKILAQLDADLGAFAQQLNDFINREEAATP